MRKTFKKVFQPIEIILRTLLGIKKIKKGQIFDKDGLIQDGREKLTRYVLFVPLYQKVKLITHVNELSDKTTIGGGGSLYSKNAI